MPRSVCSWCTIGSASPARVEQVAPVKAETAAVRQHLVDVGVVGRPLVLHIDHGYRRQPAEGIRPVVHEVGLQLDAARVVQEVMRVLGQATPSC